MRSLIGVSMIIPVIILIWKIFFGKISHKIQYALWLTIPFYMILSIFIRIPVLIPGFEGIKSFASLTVKSTEESSGNPEMTESTAVSNGDTNFLNHSEETLSAGSVQNEAKVRGASEQSAAVSGTDSSMNQKRVVKRGTVNPDSGEQGDSGISVPVTSSSRRAGDAGEDQSLLQADVPSGAMRIVNIFQTASWVVTLALVLVLSLYNCAFWLSIHRRRRLYKTVRENRIRIYTLRRIRSPFLFGRSIYIHPDMTADHRALQLAVLHEWCHYRQGDSFWPIVRYFILAVYWYNPLVWAAFVLSRRDSELSCDERVIECIGEENRIAYGNMLLRMLKRERFNEGHLSVTTCMTGKKSEMKERILSIKKPAGRKPAAVIVAGAMIILVCGCALASPGTESSAESNRAASGTAFSGAETDSAAAESSGIHEGTAVVSEDASAEKGTESNPDSAVEKAVETSYTSNIVAFNGNVYLDGAEGIYQITPDGEQKLIIKADSAKGIVVGDRMYWAIGSGYGEDAETKICLIDKVMISKYYGVLSEYQKR